MAELFFLYSFFRGQLEASNLPLNAWHSEVTVSVTGEPPSPVEKEIAKDTDIDIIPEVIEPLSIVDVLRISAVLEDTTDQLSILKYIMPVQYEIKQSTSMVYKLTIISFVFFLFLPSFTSFTHAIKLKLVIAPFLR